MRLNQIAADGNGIAPAVLDALAGMIADDALPPVREGGSIGTADLAALATTALVLSGEVATTPAALAHRRGSAPATRWPSCPATPPCSATRRWPWSTSTGWRARCR